MRISVADSELRSEEKILRKARLRYAETLVGEYSPHVLTSHYDGSSERGMGTVA